MLRDALRCSETLGDAQRRSETLGDARRHSEILEDGRRCLEFPYGVPLEFLGVPKSIDQLSLENCWSALDSSVLSLVCLTLWDPGFFYALEHRGGDKNIPPLKCYFMP